MSGSQKFIKVSDGSEFPLKDRRLLLHTSVAGFKAKKVNEDYQYLVSFYDFGRPCFAVVSKETYDIITKLSFPIVVKEHKLDRTLLGSFRHMGNWSALSNTPKLSNADIDVTNCRYNVAVKGEADFGSGSIEFDIGDIVFNDGKIWRKYASDFEIVGYLDESAKRVGKKPRNVTSAGAATTTTGRGAGSIKMPRNR